MPLPIFHFSRITTSKIQRIERMTHMWCVMCSADQCVCSLGAYHDGQGNDCSSLDQYIMAKTPTQLTDANFLNPYQFSHCSINYFRAYLNQLNMYACSQWYELKPVAIFITAHNFPCCHYSSVHFWIFVWWHAVFINEKFDFCCVKFHIVWWRNIALWPRNREHLEFCTLA